MIGAKNMNEFRISILEMLEQDSRISHKEMAMQLGTTEKSVSDEILAMEQEGIILKYNTIVNMFRYFYLSTKRSYK